MSARLEAALREVFEAMREEIRAEAEAAAGAEKLLNVQETARILGVGHATVWSEIRLGRLRSVRVRGRRLVAPSDLAAYQASRRSDA